MILFLALVTKLNSSRKSGWGSTCRCAEVLSQAGELFKRTVLGSQCPSQEHVPCLGVLVMTWSHHSPLLPAPRRDAGVVDPSFLP